MSQVRDFFEDVSEFKNLLNDAVSNASGDFENRLTGDLQQKFEEYGANMYLSESQLELIKRIAGEE